MVNTWRGQVSIEIPVRREDDSSRVYITVSEVRNWHGLRTYNIVLVFQNNMSNDIRSLLFSFLL